MLQYKFVLKLDLAFTHKVDLVKMFFTSEGVRVRSSKQCRVKITKFQVQISAAGKTEDELAERDLRIVQCAMCNVCNVECAMCNVECAMCNGNVQCQGRHIMLKPSSGLK